MGTLDRVAVVLPPFIFLFSLVVHLNVLYRLEQWKYAPKGHETPRLPISILTETKRERDVCLPPVISFLLAQDHNRLKSRNKSLWMLMFDQVIASHCYVGLACRQQQPK